MNNQTQENDKEVVQLAMQLDEKPTRREKREIIPSKTSVTRRNPHDAGQKKHYNAGDFHNWNEDAIYC